MPSLSDLTTIVDQKRKSRDLMRKLRLVVDQKEGPDAALRVMKRFVNAADAIGLRPGMVVAGYWPIVTEIDDRPLLTKAASLGAICALPVIAVDDERILTFRRWNPGEPVVEGARGTHHPAQGSPVVVPEVIIVPVLAMDREGHRLGQGGGYYDRTLARLRTSGPLVAVGLGYHIQLTRGVPNTDGDERLDWLVTENEVIQVAR